MVSALKANGIFETTMIVITAKHGQSPVDPNLFYPVPGHNHDHGTTPATLLGSTYLPDSELNQIGPTEDDVSLLWLKSTNLTQAAVDALEGTSKIPGDPTFIGLGQIYYGQSLRSMFDTPGVPRAAIRALPTSLSHQTSGSFTRRAPPNRRNTAVLRMMIRM